MTKNMGRIDRSLRVLVAAAAVAGSSVLGFATAGGVVVLVVAAVMVVTASSGYCPLYRLLGITTTGAHDRAGAGRRLSHLHRAA